MIQKLRINVCGVGIVFPHGFYTYGIGANRKLVIIGDTTRQHLKKVTYSLYDCEVYFLQDKKTWILFDIY